MVGLRFIILATAVGAAVPAIPAELPAVRVEPSTVQGPRQLQEQTARAAIQDYIDSWKSMSRALDQNLPDLLERDFTGSAKDKLTDVIRQQTSAGIHTLYSDRSHDVQVLFYSPEGLSIELADTVQYDVKLLKNERVLGVQQVQARYIVVLTPSEVRWRVRIFQAQSK